MTHYSKINEDDCWGYVGADGSLFMTENHSYDLDPFGLWIIDKNRVAVLYEGLSHGVTSEELEPESLGAAIVIVEECDPRRQAVVATVVGERVVRTECLVTATALALVSSGDLAWTEAITVTMGDTHFIVDVTHDVDTATWGARVDEKKSPDAPHV